MCRRQRRKPGWLELIGLIFVLGVALFTVSGLLSLIHEQLPRIVFNWLAALLVMRAAFDALGWEW